MGLDVCELFASNLWLGALFSEKCGGCDCVIMFPLHNLKSTSLFSCGNIRHHAPADSSTKGFHGILSSLLAASLSAKTISPFMTVEV